MQTKGWRKVLKFTYIQTIKAKSFIVSTSIMVVIFALMLAGVNFLPKLLSSAPPEVIHIVDDQGNIIAEMPKLVINKVYILNNSQLDIDFLFLQKLEVEFEVIEADREKAVMDAVTASNLAVTLVVIDENEHGGYNVKMSRPESTELVKNSDCFALLNVFSSIITDSNLISLGVAPEDVHKALIFVSASVNVGGQEPKSETAEAIAMTITMLTSVLLALLIISYGQLTAQAIATEKASRVMELLLTSVRPLAVIIGKVLATTLVALTTVAVIGGISAAAFFAFAPFGSLGEVVGMVETTDPMMISLVEELKAALAGFTFVNILLILGIFILGFLFYALISGLIGASVSKIEDLQTALQPLIFISLLGFYLAYIPPILGIDADGRGSFLVTLSRYLPISSPFALPGAILTGEIAAGEIAVAIGVLALCLGLFAIFVAKVYEHIILHNGNRIKIKDMLKLAKSKQ